MMKSLAPFSLLLTLSTAACVAATGDETQTNASSLMVIGDDPGSGSLLSPASQVRISGRPASETQVNLSWSANGTVASYSITQTLVGTLSGFFAPVTTTYSGATTSAVITLDSNLISLLTLFNVQNPVLQYAITAIGDNNTTLATATVSVSLVPEAPANLVATSAAGTTLTWSDKSLAETSFEIERSGVVAASVGQNVTNYTFTNDVYGISYNVRASNRWGKSAWSNAAELQPSGPLAQTVTLSVVATGETQFALTWTDDGAAASFVIEEQITAPNPLNLLPSSSVVTTLAGSIAAESSAYTFSSATLGLQQLIFQLEQPYLSTGTIGFRVTARDPQNATLASSGWVAVPLVPAAPSNLTATLTTSATLLQWTDNSGNETAFEIERTGETNVTVPADTTSYTNPQTTAIPYRVRATNEFGASAWSNYALP